MHQSSTALHHSSTGAQLKNPAGNGLLSFPAALFWLLFWASKKVTNYRFDTVKLFEIDAVK